MMTGNTGATGIRGFTGEPGVRGERGHTGETGRPGVTGGTGDTGRRGRSGATGELNNTLNNTALSERLHFYHCNHVEDEKRHHVDYVLQQHSCVSRYNRSRRTTRQHW